MTDFIGTSRYTSNYHMIEKITASNFFKTFTEVK